MAPPAANRRITAGAVLVWLGLGACGYDWTVVPATSCGQDDGCPKGSYCAFPDRLCGRGTRGTCRPRPRAGKCDAETVCQCTGILATSRCDAEANGHDLAWEGCKVPTGTFRCGFLRCGEDSFCVETRKGDAINATCEPFSCAERSCQCKEAAARCLGGTCQESEGGTIVRCGD